MTVLESKLRRVARRLRFLDGLSMAVTALFYGLVAATAVVVVHKLVDLGFLYGILVAAAVIAAIPAGIAAAALRKRDLFDAAMAADERLGLKDRAASAVAVQIGDYDMAELLQADAEHAAQLIDPVRHFPFAPPRQGRWIPVPLAVMLLLAAFCPEFDIFGLRRKKEKQAAEEVAIKRQAEDLKRRTEIIRKRKKARPTKREDKLLREIENAAEQLQRSKDKRGAMMKLSKAAEKLKEEKQKYDAIKKSCSNMKNLAGRTGKDGLDATKKFAEKMGKGDFKGAAEELRKLKKKLKKMAEEGKISKDELEAMKRELEKLADATKDMQSLSQPMEDLAKGLPDLSELGDYAGLEFEDAADILDDLDQISLDELKKLAELARQGQMQLKQMKLQLAKAGKTCPKCGKAFCPICGRPKCGCSGEPQCPGSKPGGS